MIITKSVKQECFYKESKMYRIVYFFKLLFFYFWAKKKHFKYSKNFVFVIYKINVKIMTINYIFDNVFYFNKELKKMICS